MMSCFEHWLRAKGYDEKTISSRIAYVRRVERFYGNLEEQFCRDRIGSVIRRFRYSTIDERQGRPNPTLIPIQGVLRTNLASYHHAIGLYRDYLGSDPVDDETDERDRPLDSSHPAPERSTDGPPTLSDFALDGLAAFQALIERSEYSTIAQAVASLTLFTHPDTVRQTDGQAVFFAIRDPKRVGGIAEIGGRRVALDDNKSPTDAFLWANRLARRGRDTQFNHIYSSSGDVSSYTALPNICMTPAFMAKLTDTDQDVRRLLRFRSFDLYGWHPAAEPIPQRPADYDKLRWAPPLKPVPDVRRAIESAMAGKPKDRTVKAARELGWLFDRERPPL